MGIKGFVAWLRTTYPQCFYPITVTAKQQVFFDELYIEINTVIHRSGRREPTAEKTREQVWHKILKEVVISLKAMTRTIVPRRLLYFSMDGAAPAAKLATQIDRRGACQSDALRTVSFDSQQITPGTLFMRAAEEALQEYAQKYITKLKEKSAHVPLTVVIDGAKRQGEGEQKVSRIVRSSINDTSQSLSKKAASDGDHDKPLYVNNHVTTRCVIADDGDTYLNVLAWNRPSCYVFQHFIPDETEPKLLFSVDEFRRSIPNPLDFILLCLMTGTDYGPPVGLASYKVTLPFFHRLHDPADPVKLPSQHNQETKKPTRQSLLVNGRKRTLQVTQIKEFAAAFIAEYPAPTVIAPFREEHRSRIIRDPFRLRDSLLTCLRHLQWAMEMMLTGRGSHVDAWDDHISTSSLTSSLLMSDASPSYRISLFDLAKMTEDECQDFQRVLDQDAANVGEVLQVDELSAGTAAVTLLKNTSPELIFDYIPSGLLPIHQAHTSNQLQSIEEVRQAVHRAAATLSKEDLDCIKAAPLVVFGQPRFFPDYFNSDQHENKNSYSDNEDWTQDVVLRTNDDIMRQLKTFSLKANLSAKRPPFSIQQK